MKYVNLRYPLVKGEVEQKKCYLITARTLPVFPFLLKLKTNVPKKKIYGQWPSQKIISGKKFECRETHHVKIIYVEFLKSPDELRKERGQPFIKWISGCLQ